MTNKNIDWLYVTPFLGYELVKFGLAQLNVNPNCVQNPGPFTCTPQELMCINDPSACTQTEYLNASGFTFGGVAGVRFGFLGLGLLYQRTQSSVTLSSGGKADFAFNKLYGELSLNSQWSKMIMLFHFNFGYSFLSGIGSTQSGFGGKIGLAFDFYPMQIFSIGAGVAFDGQGYSLPQGLAGAFGGTFVARLGLHL
jgi:hypothetical protein